MDPHITVSAVLVAAVLGIALRFLVALLAKQHDRTVQSILSIVISFVGVGVATATNLTGNIDLWGFLLTVLGTGVAAQGAHGSWLGDLAGKLNRKTGEAKPLLGRTYEQIHAVKTVAPAALTDADTVKAEAALKANPDAFKVDPVAVPPSMPPAPPA